MLPTCRRSSLALAACWPLSQPDLELQGELLQFPPFFSKPRRSIHLPARNLLSPTSLPLPPLSCLLCGCAPPPVAPSFPPVRQERAQKQKLVEQKNKMDADTITGKRQREDDEKKEKARKKKCIEEVRKQQKQQDDKELGKDLVGGVKNQLVPDERTESGLIFIASENNNLKAVVADGRSECSGLQVQESLSDGVDKERILG